MRRNLLVLAFFGFAVMIDAKFDIVYNVLLTNHPGNLITTSLSTYGRDPRPISGNITILKDLTDKHRMSVDILRLDYDQVVDFPGLKNRRICEAITAFYDPYFKTTLTSNNTNLNFKEGKLCPVPKGNYWVKDIVFDINEWKTFSWRVGTYIVTLTIFNEDATFGGGIELLVRVNPFYI
ncbi:uncharacterized protein LOC119551279 [Drosophila subpulchrella]|uniref:uncharacterized protein LOC119551279 n=1 Tax=Drosophila subpulchrella TaxID=1486046 RepID=UPI0018A19495|nr:uncharacterized protein LOC119551279 [Drosophila subpulchrella]